MRAALAVAVACLLAGCGGGSSHPSSASAPRARIALSSPAFGAGAQIPRQYTCDGRDISPPLRWSGLPHGAGALTLTMRDPDAPGGNFVHWTVSAIPSTVGGLTPGRLPTGAVPGRNSFGTVGYRGPCPPRGDKPHRYVITLSATRAGTPALASGTLVGIYARR